MSAKNFNFVFMCPLSEGCSSKLNIFGRNVFNRKIFQPFLIAKIYKKKQLLFQSLISPFPLRCYCLYNKTHDKAAINGRTLMTSLSTLCSRTLSKKLVRWPSSLNSTWPVWPLNFTCARTVTFVTANSHLRRRRRSSQFNYWVELRRRRGCDCKSKHILSS